MGAPAVERVLDIGNYLGETPVWSVSEQALYWVNCEKEAELHRWSPGSGSHRVWPMPRRIGGFVLKSGGGALVALADGLYDFDPAKGDVTLRTSSPLPPQVMLHECMCDRQGRFWIGAYDHGWTPQTPDSCDAAYFRLDGDKLSSVIGDIHIANGLAVSPDGRTLYAGDSPAHQIYAFDLDPATGALANRRIFLELARGDGHIDGATVDALGGYWLAVVGKGQLRRYLPGGTLDRTIELPFSNPTKPAFGGPDLDVIYVTSTKMAIPPSGTAGVEQNGGLFAVHAGVRGLEDPKLRA